MFGSFVIFRWQGAESEEGEQAEQDVAEPRNGKKSLMGKKKKCAKKTCHAEKAATSLPDDGNRKAKPKGEDYSKARLSFIADAVENGKSSKDASKMWLSSDRRAALVANMSQSELVRRRFVQPAKPRSKK